MFHFIFEFFGKITAEERLSQQGYSLTGKIDLAPLSNPSKDEDAKDIIAELMASNEDASQIVGRFRADALQEKRETELASASQSIQNLATQKASTYPQMEPKRRKLNETGSRQQVGHF